MKLRHWLGRGLAMHQGMEILGKKLGVRRQGTGGLLRAADKGGGMNDR